MAINKKQAFAEAELTLADFAKSMGHPARVAILKVLAQRKTCICGEIVEVLPLAQSTVSQHLKELLKAGLIQGTVDGAKSCYCINWETFGQFEALFQAFFVKANKQRTTNNEIMNESIKSIVREKYTIIATQDKTTNETSCCGVGGCDPVDATGTYTIMSESYAALPGYSADADLGLGCGLPTEFAKIQPGDTVVDLGSGAGNDCFVARAEAGDSGKVIGIDFTPAMIDLARSNAEKLRFNNVEFRQGDIEALPLNDSSVDVIVSNCVLNLVPDKPKVFAEMMRTLRPGGHFSISDIVLVGELPEALVQSAEMYAGCVSGAIQMNDYMDLIRQAGFEDISIQKQKPIMIPDHILLQYLTPEGLNEFRTGAAGIFSITIFAQKAGASKRSIDTSKPMVKLGEKAACCAPGCCD